MDELLSAGHSLLGFKSGGVVVVYIINKGTEEKLAVGHGADIQEAMADLWEKTNGQRDRSERDQVPPR